MAKERHSKVEVICAICGEKIFKNYNEWKNNKTGKFYCSREHSSLGRRGYKMDKTHYMAVFCEYCCAPKFILPSQYESSPNKIYFCNDNHMHRWQSLNWKGENSPIYGIIRSEETKKKISESKKGVPASESLRRKNRERSQSDKHPWWGRNHSEETKIKISESLSKMFLGENNPNWRGGKSLENYGPEFNNKLKSKIRDRDEHICQLCGEPENGISLAIHHIDYNKKNNDDSNLISLHNEEGLGCHQKTNGNREYWTKYFQNLLSEKYGYSYEVKLKFGGFLF